MSLRFMLPSLLAGAVCAAPVQAQDLEYSTEQTRALMHEYARCVVKRQGKKASEALLSNVDNGTILRRYGMLIVGDCLADNAKTDTTTMSFAGDLYRYALADALVGQELADTPVPDVSDLPPLDHRDPGEPPRQITASGKKVSKKKYEQALESHNRGVAYAFLGRYGECIIRFDAPGAKALLLTKPDSREEAIRFAALKPALASCLPEGHTLTFGKVPLRGSIAVNYYRLAHAVTGRAAG